MLKGSIAMVVKGSRSNSMTVKEWFSAEDPKQVEKEFVSMMARNCKCFRKLTSEEINNKICEGRVDLIGGMILLFDLDNDFINNQIE